MDRLWNGKHLEFHRPTDRMTCHQLSSHVTPLCRTLSLSPYCLHSIWQCMTASDLGRICGNFWYCEVDVGAADLQHDLPSSNIPRGLCLERGSFRKRVKRVWKRRALDLRKRMDRPSVLGRMEIVELIWHIISDNLILNSCESIWIRSEFKGFACFRGHTWRVMGNECKW